MGGSGPAEPESPAPRAPVRSTSPATASSAAAVKPASVTPPVASATSQRKLEHLEIAASGAIESVTGPGWEDVHLVHRCLPEVSRSTVDLSARFLGRTLRAPVVIAAITGGHPRATEINRRLAGAAEALGLAMGVGSQRAAVEQPDLISSYAVAREAAPSAFLIANIGAPQLIRQERRRAYGLPEARALTSALGANALAIHLNFLQEACQPEGDVNAAGVAGAIGAICEGLEIPVIAKETGAGMCREDALHLKDLGVSALDVGGYGGSNMALLEAERAERQEDRLRQRISRTFATWGIPTAAAVLEARATGLPVIATGGIRTGLDAAKAIALGATLVGIARPALAQAEIGMEALIEWLEGFLEELKVAAFLTGCADLAAISALQPRIFGRTADWMRQIA